MKVSFVFICFNFNFNYVNAINNNLILRTYKLVPFYANKILYKHKIPYEDKKDIIQEGYMGMIRASQKYNESYNTSFSYYSKFWIDRYIFNALEKYYKNKNKQTNLVENINNSKKNYNLDQYEIIHIKNEINNLNAEEKDLIIRKYFKKEKIINIAKHYSVSRDTITNRIKKILYKLKLKLNYNRDFI